MSNDNPTTMANRSLRAVRPSSLEAMVNMSKAEPERLSAIVAMVNAGTTDSEVAAYAVSIAPRMWMDANNGAPLLAIVRGAIRKAERTVALSKWDTYGDMLDLETSLYGSAESESVDVRPNLAQYGTRPADARYGVTYADIVATALGMADEPALYRAVGDLRAVWADSPRAGRPVTLQGATAYRDGLAPTDSRYHSTRRATVAAMRRLDKVRVLRMTGAPGERVPTKVSKVNAGMGDNPHKRPTSVIPGRAGRVVLGRRVVRRESVTVDYRWEGSTDARISVWLDGRIVRQAVGMGSIMPSRIASMSKETRHGGMVPCDSLGYPLSLGYGTSPDAAMGGWVPVREVREVVREVPTVSIPGTRAMLPPTALIVRNAYSDAAPVVRMLSDDERAVIGDKDGNPTDGATALGTAPGKAPSAPSGDERHAQPDDKPLGGKVLANGQIGSGKVPVSPRKRVGGNTGSTVPVILPR